MTQKDYIAIAEVLRDSLDACTDNGRGDIRARAIADIAVRLGDDVLSSNPRFDRARFLDACKVEREGPMTGRGWDRPADVRSFA